jgi:hypothetical protein
MSEAIVVNPLSQEISVQLETKLVAMEEAKFGFRTTEVKDELGKTVIDEATKKPQTWKRPTLALQIPLLTRAGLMAALSANDKSAELALSQVNQVITDRVRGLLQDAIENNPKVELTPEIIDISKLNFLEIAMLPRSERGAGISKEDWASFAEDYIEVMQKPETIADFPDKRKRELETLQTHATLLTGKFNQVKSRKDVVEQMNVFLDIWAAHSNKLEEHQACYELLKGKANTIMQGNDYTNL